MVRKKTVSSVGILIFTCLVVVGAGAFWLFREVKSSRLGRFERTTVVVNFGESSEGILLLSIDKNERKTVEISLDKDLYVPTAYGYGNYRLGKVWGVGSLDGRGGQVLAATVANLAGVPVDGYLSTNSGGPYFENGLGVLKTAKSIFLGKLETNLSFVDLVKIFRWMVGLRSDQVKRISLEKMGVLEELVLSDGTKAKSVDAGKLDYLKGDLFEEKNLREEGLKVGIINVGGKTGEGARAERVLKGIGVDVVSVENGTGSLVQNCELLTEKKWMESKTVGQLAQIFGCKLVTSSEPLGRVDLTVRLRSVHPGE